MMKRFGISLLALLFATSTAFATVEQAIRVVPGQVPGTSTNDTANAGNVGQIVTSSVACSSTTGLSTGVAANVTSISVTAGDWDVDGIAGVQPAGTTTLNTLVAGLSTSSATLPAVGNAGRTQLIATLTTGSQQVIPTGRLTVSVSGTTSVFLIVLVGFGTSTAGGCGTITARRVR